MNHVAFCFLLLSLVVGFPGVIVAQNSNFIRGEANGDGLVNIADPVFTLLALFRGKWPIPCEDAADSNDDGKLGIPDAVYTLNRLFRQGNPPAAPYPSCGPDPTIDNLGCEESACEVLNDGVPTIASHFIENVEITLDGDQLVLRTDDVPNHPSPYFGVGDARYIAPHDGMVLNPNRIREQNLTFRVPVQPKIASSPSDTGLGPIGVAVNGVVLFNQYAARFSPLDAEIATFDIYKGHPAPAGTYHYHLEPISVTQADPSALVGVMLDGFPIYGPEDTDGRRPTDLDDCNGHFGQTPDHPAGIYHYHTTDMEPYLVGCYRGTPGRWTN